MKKYLNYLNNCKFYIKKNRFANKIYFFTELHDFSLVLVSGLDSTSYLNSQFTINVPLLKTDKHILCAHCNSSGKVWSVLHLLHYDKGYAYIQRNNVCNIQIQELKKYSVFSDVNISKKKDFYLFGVTGLHARYILSFYFTYLPNKNKTVVYIKNNILLWFKFPCERFLLVLNKKTAVNIKNLFFNKHSISTIDYWSLLNIQTGIPIVEIQTTGKFTPQELNLNIFNGIDYKKGCYIGQEVVSRIHFKNIKNRKIYYLIGYTDIVPKTFSKIEMYNGIFWKLVGNVVFMIHIKKNIFGIQCMLNKNINFKGIFRMVNDKNSRFEMK